MSSEMARSSKASEGLPPPSVMVVQEAVRPISDWEVVRGVLATALAMIVGGLIGGTIGGWGDKKGESRARNIGGLLLAGVSGILAASANSRRVRDDTLPSVMQSTRQEHVSAAMIDPSNIIHPQAQVAASSVTHDGHIGAISQQYGAPSHVHG